MSRDQSGIAVTGALGAWGNAAPASSAIKSATSHESGWMAGGTALHRPPHLGQKAGRSPTTNGAIHGGRGWIAKGAGAGGRITYRARANGRCAGMTVDARRSFPTRYENEGHDV